MNYTHTTPLIALMTVLLFCSCITANNKNQRDAEMIDIRMEKAEKRIKELEATSEWLVRSNVGIMNYVEGCLSNESSNAEARNLDGTPVTQEELAAILQDYFMDMEKRIGYLESTSDWLVRFSSTLREDVFEEIEKYLNNMPHDKPCECKETIDAMTKKFYKDFDEKVRIAVDECLNGNDNSPAMDVVTKDGLGDTVDEIYATIRELGVSLRVHAEGLNKLTEKKINKMFRETCITRDDLNAALEEERANYEKYVEDFISDNGMDRPTVDPGDIEEVYSQMGELEKNFREFEDGVQQEFIKLEKKLKDIAEITASMLKQLDSITQDVGELMESGVGLECQGLDDATDSTLDDIFKKLEEHDKKLKYLESIIQKMLNKKKEKGEIKTTEGFWNMKIEELIHRLSWLLKNGSIDKDEQEINELVGELRDRCYVTLGAWNLFKQTMGYDYYIEQEPHLEKSLESIYSILKKDKLFEIPDRIKKTTTQP